MTRLADIPSRLRVPLAYIDISNVRAVTGTPNMPFKVLFFGNMTATGKATAEVPVRVLSEDQAEQLFGINSQLAAMFRAGKKVDRLLETWAIPIADKADGVAATGSIAFAVNGLNAGSLYLYIAGMRLVVGITADLTAADIATKVAAAINAEKRLPVTAAVDGVDDTKVNITAVHKGDFTNDIDISLNYYADESTPIGLAPTITAMANGSGNPDIANAIAAMGDEWWNYIVVGYSDNANLTALRDEMSGRWGPTRMMDSQAVVAYRGTHANSSTFAESWNSKFLIALTPGKVPQPSWVWAAAVMMTVGASLAEDPARPVHEMTVTGLMPPRLADRWTLEERNLMLFSGGSTFKTDAGGQVVTEGIITTYRVNSFEADDPSYLYVTTLATLAYLRYSVRARISQKYPRHKLANDGTNYAAGQPIVTPNTIRAELVSLFREWEGQGLVENFSDFKDQLIVERDVNDRNRLNVIMGPDLVNQFVIFAAQIQFVL